MTRLSIFSFIPFAFFFFSVQAQCECDSSLSEKAYAESANLIFTGTAAEIVPNWVSGGIKVSFRVSRSWKRKAEPYFTIHTPDPSACGFEFQVGKEYLVFVEKKFNFTTNRCLPTREISGAMVAADGFGESFTPGTNASMKKWMMTMSLLVMAGMIFLGIIVWRRRSRSA